MSIGKTLLGRRHVQPSVASTLTELMVEGTFTTGSYLVTVHDPISSDNGHLERALYGSFLPVPSTDLFPLPDADAFDSDKVPGTVVVAKEKRIILNEGRKRIRLKVTSQGDRPIQVGAVLILRIRALSTNHHRSALTIISSRQTLSCRLTASVL